MKLSSLTGLSAIFTCVAGSVIRSQATACADDQIFVTHLKAHVHDATFFCNYFLGTPLPNIKPSDLVDSCSCILHAAGASPLPSAGSGPRSSSAVTVPSLSSVTCSPKAHKILKKSVTYPRAFSAMTSTKRVASGKKHHTGTPSTTIITNSRARATSTTSTPSSTSEAISSGVTIASSTSATSSTDGAITSATTSVPGSSLSDVPSSTSTSTATSAPAIGTSSSSSSTTTPTTSTTTTTTGTKTTTSSSSSSPSSSPSPAPPGFALQIHSTDNSLNGSYIRIYKASDGDQGLTTTSLSAAARFTIDSSSSYLTETGYNGGHAGYVAGLTSDGVNTWSDFCTTDSSDAGATCYMDVQRLCTRGANGFVTCTDV
ncbi:hypothetical protein ANO11243_094110 [Dothideomycetidae sp. 11243]|nr:hypothetical protein ANO11243_094110 [fungal sp. No.11243]